jgi:copper transport protein
LTRLAAAAIAAVLLVLATAAPASAHARFEGSTPEADAQLDTAPAEVVLRFSEAVQTDSDAVRVLDRTGRPVDDGRIERFGSGRQVKVGLEPIGEGAFVVAWRVVSADAHPIRGAFTFRVGDAEALDAATVAGITGDQGAGRAVGVAYGVVRFLAFAALIVVVGGLAFLTFIWPAGTRLRRARRLLWIGWGVLAAATVLGLGLQGATTDGLGLGDALRPGVIADVLDTRFGVVWLGRLALLAALVPVLWMVRHEGSDDPVWRVIALTVSLGLLATPALSGHASAGDLVPAAIAIDVVHLAAVSVWLGGLLLLVAAVLPRRDHDELRSVVPRFSTVAFGAVAAIVLTGSLQSLRQVGSLDDLVSTTFGRLLLSKVAAFAGLVALGGWSRSVLHRRLAAAQPPVALPVGPGAARADPDAETTRRLRRSVGIEVAVAALVLALTAALVNATPARSATDDPGTNPFAATVLADDRVHVDLRISPAISGENDVEVLLHLTEDPGGAPFEVGLSLTQAAQDVGPIDVPLEASGGAYVAEDVDLPIAGEWTAEVEVLLTEIDAVKAEFTVPVQGP